MQRKLYNMVENVVKPCKLCSNFHFWEKSLFICENVLVSSKDWYEQCMSVGYDGAYLCFQIMARIHKLFKIKLRLGNLVSWAMIQGKGPKTCIWY